jgi:hypothetical protein
VVTCPARGQEGENVAHHRYINLDVGYDKATPGGGRKGGDPEHADYKDAKQVAQRVEQILRAAGERDSLLSGYKLIQVEPSDAHPNPDKPANKAAR